MNWKLLIAVCGWMVAVSYLVLVADNPRTFEDETWWTVFIVLLVIGVLLIFAFRDKKPKEEGKQSMNRKQRICVWTGVVAIVLMGIYPPWMDAIVIDDSLDGNVVIKRDLGYHHITRPIWKRHIGARVNTGRLCVQWFAVTFVTGGLIAAFAEKKDKKPKDEEKQ